MSFLSPGAPGGRALAFVLLFNAFLLTPLFPEENPPPEGGETTAEVEKDKEKNQARQDEAPDVVVTATRIPDERLRVPPFVISVTRPLITAGGKDSLPEVAAQNAGVRLFDYGPGGLGQLWLRGATGTRVLVLLDGVPTNNALDGQMSLSLIPVEMVERLEIVQGGMSLLYGSQAVGGVINVITRKGRDLDNFFTASIANTSFLPQDCTSGGSNVGPQAVSLFDGERASVSFGRDFGPFGFFAAGIFDWSRNEYCYQDAGTVFRRDNAGLVSGSGITAMSFPWTSGAVGVTAMYTRQLAGVPGAITYLTPNARETDERFQALAAYHEEKFLSDALTLDAKVSFTKQYRLYEDPTPPFPISDAGNLTAFFGELSQKAKLADWLALQYGGNVAVDMVTGDSSGDHTRISGSAFLAVPLSFADALRIFPAGRVDLSSDYGGELSYGLGAAWLVSKEASLKLSAAKSFRAPTLNELYNVYGSNPSLQPERGWHADLGFSLQTKPVKLESALFVRYMENEIKYYPPAYIPQNIDHSFYPGAEIQAEAEFIDHFFAEAGYTFIYSFNLAGGLTLADNIRVTNVPVNEAHLYLSYRTEPLVIRLGLDAIGERYSDAANTTLLPWAFVLNANVRWQAAKWVTVIAALDNILNTQYQIINGYPMPGIKARWGLEVKF